MTNCRDKTTSTVNQSSKVGDNTSAFMVRRSHTDSLPTLGALSSPVGFVVNSRPTALHVNCKPCGLLAIATTLHHVIRATSL